MKESSTSRWEPSEPTFKGWDCPACGTDEVGDDFLYCEDCAESLAEKMGDELEEQHS